MINPSKPTPPHDAVIADESLVEEARGRLSAAGVSVIDRFDPEYDGARSLFYFGLDRRPAIIARPLDAAGVVAVVSTARETGMPLAVRSGGHSVVGHSACDGGIVLDLCELRQMDIDPQARTAWAGTGLTAGEYTASAGRHGLVTGFGDSASVGIGGITLGGGMGLLHRKLGLTIDQLLSADVVTADGRILTADEYDHADLFWAIRGGGGNFGVATRFQFRLHELRTIVGGMLAFRATPEVVEQVLTEADAAPAELSGIINVMPAPPMPLIDPEYHGELVVVAFMVFADGPDVANPVFERFRSIAPPIVDMIDAMPYPAVYEGPEPPHPAFGSVRSMFSDGIGRDDAGQVMEALAASTAPMRVAQFRILGGAVAEVAADATAFAHRNRRMMIQIGALYEHAEESEQHDGWVEGLASSLRRGNDGAYINFLGDEGEQGVRRAYPGATWDRLTQIKAKYDPTNLFRLNQNVPPS